MNRNCERALALAGLIQSCYLVSGIARTGLVGEDSLAGCLDSIFVTNPDETLDVYCGGNGVRTGLRLIMEIAGDLQISEYAETVRYTGAVLKLEGKLRQHPEVMRSIGAGISAIQEHRSLRDMAVTSEEIVERLSALYEQTAGTFEPRIRVLGQQKHLQNKANTTKIRSLLLSALRSAVLWHQLGGSRMQVFLGRRKLLQATEEMAGIIS